MLFVLEVPHDVLVGGGQVLQVAQDVADLSVGVKLANLGALDVKLALVDLHLVLLHQRLEVVNVLSISLFVLR